MIEFPIITKLQEDSLAKGVAKGIDIGRTEAQQAMCQSIMDILETRFGQLPADIAQKLRGVAHIDELKPLIKLAALCPDLTTFAQSL